MKIIQSLYFNNLSNDLSAGWNSEKYHAYSWALSCLTIKKNYPNIQLYTNNNSFNWLINKINLPYKNVYNNLNIIDNYNVALWSLAKIYTYSLQDTPFLHLDGDIYIWQKFNENLLLKPIIVQNFEINFNYNYKIISQFLHEFNNFPDFFYPINLNNITSINAGIIGGKNVALYKEFYTIVIQFVEKNIPLNYSIKTNNINNIIEQFFFSLFIINKKYKIFPVFKKVDENNVFINQFNLAPLIKKIIHPLGTAKKNIIFNTQVEYRLKYQFPKMYNHINNLYPSKKIYIQKSVKEKKRKIHVIKIFKNTLHVCSYYKLDYNVNCTFKKFCTWFENIFEQNIDKIEFLFISDIYQLEKMLYSLKKNNKNKIKSYLFNKNFKKINLLYKLNLSKFNNTLFKLDNKICSILYLNYDLVYPLNTKNISNFVKTNIHNLHENFNKKTKIYIAFINADFKIEIKELTKIETSLYFFDNNANSVNSTLSLIKQHNLNIENYNLLDVLNFVTFHLIYTNLLKIAD